MVVDRRARYLIAFICLKRPSLHSCCDCESFVSRFSEGEKGMLTVQTECFLKRQTKSETQSY